MTQFCTTSIFINLIFCGICFGQKTEQDWKRSPLFKQWDIAQTQMTSQSFLLFFGHLKDRIAADDIPDAWQYDLCFDNLDSSILGASGATSCGGKYFYDVSEYEEISVEGHSLRIWVRKGVDAKLVNGKLRVKTQTADVSVDWREFSRHSYRYSIEITEANGRLFVAVFEPFGETYPLICIDPNDNSVLWRQNVWATGSQKLTIKTGFWFHRVKMKSNANCVSVFGDGCGNYVEEFQVRNGRALCRFSTTGWFTE